MINKPHEIQVRTEGTKVTNHKVNQKKSEKGFLKFDLGLIPKFEKEPQTLR